MSKEEKVIKYYVLCNKLKNVIRTGWKIWNVKRERMESIAEHVYSTQMLALVMWDTYQYDIDIFKVAFMLAIHEIGETVIGDITQFEKSKEEKERLEHEAVNKILTDFNTDMIEKLFLEFDEGKTKEAFFAFECDKLEWDLQAKLYGEEGCVDLDDQEGNKVKNTKIVKRLLDEGNSWEEMCLKFGQEVYPYDDNFRSVSNYALTHKISKN